MTLLRWREHPAASAELLEAAIWYDSQTIGLGERLSGEVAASVEFIRAWPDASPVYRGWQRRPIIRRKNLDVFPYGAIYLVRDAEVIIVAYAHEKRRPGYWRDRLKNL